MELELDGGGVDAGKIGGLLGGLATTGLGLLGGGSGGGATAGVGAGAAGAGSTGLTAAETTAELGAVSVTESLTAGGVFAFGWLVYFFLQFLLMNTLDGLRNGWLRWRYAAYELNIPLHHLQRLELNIIEATCQQLGLGKPVTTNADDRAVVYANGYAGFESRPDGSDPRLTEFKRNIDATSAPEYFNVFRQIVSNPFPASDAHRDVKWLFMQMNARLVAARYVFDLGSFARSFIQGWFGQAVPGPNDSAADVWNYPLAGGGQPLPIAQYASGKVRQVPGTYEATYAQFKALKVGIDDELAAARLQALLHVAALVQQDPALYVPWDAVGYSAKLYTAMGVDAQRDGISLTGATWTFDVARFKVPCSRLFLDIEKFARAGLPLQPFVPGSNGYPTPAFLTSLVALP